MGTFSIWHWVVVIIIIVIYVKYKNKKSKKEKSKKLDLNKVKKDEIVSNKDFNQKTKEIREQSNLKKNQAQEEKNQRNVELEKNEEILRRKKEFFQDELMKMRNEYKESDINLVKFSEYVFIHKNLEGYVDKLTFTLDFTTNKTKGLMTGGERFNNINNRENLREGLRNLSDYIESFTFALFVESSGELYFQYSANEIRWLVDPPHTHMRVDDGYIHHKENDFLKLKNFFHSKYLNLIVEQCGS